MTRSDLAPLLIALHDLQDKITLDKRHCYRMNKQTVPGVTTVIKTMDAPALDAWKVRVQVEGTARAAMRNPPPNFYDYTDEEAPMVEAMYVDKLVQIAKKEFEHDRLANEAADVGKQVHALIEHAVKEQLGQETKAPEATDEALFIFAGWREWAESVGLEPLAAEARLYHPLAEYCGTADLIALVEGKPAVLDWKPQVRLYPERRMQSAAYRQALVEMGWPDMEGYIVALPRDGGEIEMVPIGPTRDDYGAFLNCLDLYRWLKQLQRAERKAAKDDEAA
jgi:hypothetical protein